VDPGLPTGTVTLLFSDIQGSTILLRRLGEGYADALSAQRSLLRSAFAHWHGHEMGTEGDSFFVVFTSAGDAVAAALEAQRGLGAHAWAAGEPVRVRMGLHTGEPDRYEDGYIGLDVHLAARVAAVAHGGQVVLTEATQRIASSHLSDGTSVLDLGWHRLKDIPEPVHLYQLTADGLEHDFPPVRSLGGRTQLPAQVASTVGRDGELRLLQTLVVDQQAPLVTLTGPGGSGKTRLAVALAATLVDAFPDGVFFVPLESVTTVDVMWTALADALGVAGDDQSPSALVGYLSGRRTLIVLDNLEQLPPASTVVQELLGAPDLRIVATSRRPLHVYGEFEHPVPPLTLPAPAPGDGESVAELHDSGAVQLFVMRAQLVRPGFVLDADNAADVAAICRMLDGLPLAIELAAARVKLLGPRALRTRLATDLELLAVHDPGRPARQQTLGNAVTWSYRLLPAELQYFLRQLGAFTGSFDLEAAAAVAGPGLDPLDAIGELVDVSLVNVRDGPDGEPRVHLLRTVSSFVRHWLAEAGELDAASARHAEHYASLVEAVAPQLRSRYVTARDRIEAELDNVRGGLAWALPDASEDGDVAPGRAGVGLRLCTALSWFWYSSGYQYQAEARRWLSRAVDAAAGQEGADLMTSLHGLAVLLLQHGENEPARDALHRCLGFWRRECDDGKVAMELSSLGAAYRALGEPELARTALEESIGLARALGDKGRLATALSNLALVDLDRHDSATAMDRWHEALGLDEALGDTWGVAADRINLVGALVHDGRAEEARRDLSGVARETVALGDVELTVNVLELFAMIFAELADPVRAARLLGAAEAMRRRAELPIAAADAALLQRSIGRVRSAAGENWERDAETGAGYTLDTALDTALDGTEPARPQADDAAVRR
jgi:predicted ATPase/class 3 adenylate cyclase